MKEIKVVYENGLIKSASDNGGLYDQEDKALKVNATISVEEGKKVRAYIKASNNNSTVTDEIIAENGIYSVVIDGEYMAEGTLYVGFEIYDENGYAERFQPLKIYIDAFVSLNKNSGGNVYVVTVDIGTVTTLEPDEVATVENVGTKKDMILKFGIPRGQRVSLGEVTPLESTEEPTAAMVADGGDVKLNLGLPRAPKVEVADEIDILEPDKDPYVEDVNEGADIRFKFSIPRNQKIDVEEIEVLDPGEDPYVENVNEGQDITLKFGIPKNQNIAIEPVYTLSPEEEAVVQNIGDEKNIRLKFGIPRGIQGIQGPKGEQGIQGEKGDTGEVSLEYAHSTFSGVIENNAEGKTIQLTDSADAKLKGLNVYGKTIQDGTPTPDAPIDLESVGDDGNVNMIISGKNLFDVFNQEYSPSYNRCSAEVLEDGTLRVTNKAVVGYTLATCLMPYPLSNFVGKKLTLSLKTKCSNEDLYAGAVVRYLKEGGENGGGKEKFNYGSSSISITANLTEELLQTNKYLALHFYTNATGSPIGAVGDYVDFTDIQFEISDVATEFEPYTGNSISLKIPNSLKGIPVTSDGNYTDSNGQQWICDEIDFGKGVYIQRTKTIDISTLSWTYNSQYALHCSSIADGIIYNTIKTNCSLCTHFPLHVGSPTYNMNDKAFQHPSVYSTINSYLVVKNSDYDNATDFKNYLTTLSNEGNPVMLCYILAEPIETPLTEEEIATYKALQTYKPITNITNGEGAGMSVDYIADTKNYIDNKFAELSQQMKHCIMDSNN